MSYARKRCGGRTRVKVKAIRVTQYSCEGSVKGVSEEGTGRSVTA
jgi:hypothetical protein